MKSILWALMALLIAVACVAALLLWYCLGAPGRSYQGAFQEISTQERMLEEKLRRYVQVIAGDFGERHVHGRYEALLAAAGFIDGAARAAGATTVRQSFSAAGKEVWNIVVPATGPDPILILGAHYDSAAGTPGANDNASGVAALLVILEELSRAEMGSRIEYVFFVNEEPPFFGTDSMGSAVHALGMSRSARSELGMWSLETIGYYSDAPQSQTYPWPLSAFYPSTGNFLAFAADLQSRSFLHRTVAAFRSVCRFPSEAAALPGDMPGVGWSDHASYWKHAIPAVMITDTAPYRYPHYHELLDVPEMVNYKKLARITAGLRDAAVRLLSDSRGS